MVKTMTRITSTRQGSPARGMSGVAFTLLLMGLNLAMLHGCTVIRYNLSIAMPRTIALPVDSAGVLRRRRAPAPPSVSQRAGVWKLRQSSDLPLSGVAEPIARLGVRRAGTAVYDGAGTLQVEMHEMTSTAGALEAEQTWTPEADTVAFHRESYFTVVHWENATRESVPEFVREMRKPPVR